MIHNKDIKDQLLSLGYAIANVVQIEDQRLEMGLDPKAPLSEEDAQTVIAKLKTLLPRTSNGRKSNGKYTNGNARQQRADASAQTDLVAASQARQGSMLQAFAEDGVQLADECHTVRQATFVKRLANLELRDAEAFGGQFHNFNAGVSQEISVDVEAIAATGLEENLPGLAGNFTDRALPSAGLGFAS